MNLPNLRANVFSIETNNLGTLNFSRENMKLLNDTSKLDLEKTPPLDLIDKIICILGEKPDQTKITENDVKELSEEEKESFAKSFIEAHPELNRKVVIRLNNDKGTASANIVPADTDILNPKEENEKWSEYLLRLWSKRIKEHKEHEEKFMSQWKKTYGGIFERHKDIFDSPLQKLFQDNQRFSNLLGERLDNFAKLRDFSKVGNISKIAQESSVGRLSEDLLKARPVTATIEQPKFKMPEIPPHPAHETNILLEEVVEKLDGLQDFSVETASMVKSLNDAAKDFLIKFAAASDDANKAAKKTLRIAIIALIISAAPFCYSIWYNSQSSKEQRLLIEQFQTQISDLKNSQNENMKSLIEETRKASNNEVKAIKQSAPIQKEKSK